MKIYTTNFANLRNVPKDIIPISICGKSPDWWEGLKYPALAPKYWWWRIWKDEDKGEDWYTQKYMSTVLDCLMPISVVSDLKALAEDHDIALVCYEKPGDFCHRHLVAQWLRDAGYSVEEWETGGETI